MLPENRQPQLNLFSPDPEQSLVARALHIAGIVLNWIGCTIGLLFLLPLLPVVAIAAAVCYLRDRAYDGLVLFGRAVTRTRVQFPRQEAIEIAAKHMGSNGVGEILVKDRISHYDIYLDIQPDDGSGDWEGAQVQVNVTTGDVISAKRVPRRRFNMNPSDQVKYDSAAIN